MPYVAKERIFLNDANRPCAEDDPRVAVMLVRPGGQLSNRQVGRFGLGEDKRLIRIPDPSDDPAPERGQTYYEATGQEPPAPTGGSRILGETPQDAARQEAPAREAAPAERSSGGRRG
jgi:hypothetical protein